MSSSGFNPTCRSAGAESGFSIMGDPVKDHTARAAEISRHFHESMRRLFARAVSPRFRLSISAGPAPGRRMTRERHALFRRNLEGYLADTRHLLRARGLMTPHRRSRTHEFIVRALFYMDMWRRANVELELQFGVRELPPRWMRVKGHLRLVSGRAVYEFLTVVVNGVRRRFFEHTHFDGNGHFLFFTQVGFQGGDRDAALFQWWCESENNRRIMRRTDAESTNRGDQDANRQVPGQDKEAVSSVAQDEAASEGENEAAQDDDVEAAPTHPDEAALHGEDEDAQPG